LKILRNGESQIFDPLTGDFDDAGSLLMALPRVIVDVYAGKIHPRLGASHETPVARDHDSGFGAANGEVGAVQTEGLTNLKLRTSKTANPELPGEVGETVV
jgi:hypothetical protein